MKSLKRKFKNLLKVMECYVLYFVKYFNGSKNSNVFLVIHTAKMGDMICATPVFRSIKNNLPNMKLIVAGNALNKELLEGNNDIDEYVVWPDGDSEKKDLINKLHPKYALLISPNFDSLYSLLSSCVYKISAPFIKCGFSPYESLAYKILLTLVNRKPHHMNSYAPREYLRLLEPFGIFSTETKKYLFHTKEADKFTDSLISESGAGPNSVLIGIVIDVGNPIKTWSTENFVKVSRHIKNKYKNSLLFLISGKANTEGVVVFKKLADFDFVDLSGRLSLDELKSFISKLDLLIGVDTGPMYIAEAYCTPLVDIIGPVSEKEQPPIQDFSRLVYLKDRKSPEVHIMNARSYNYEEARRQIEQISPEMVIYACEELLTNSSKF